MRKRLTLDILGISNTDRAVIKQLSIEQYGKSSISYFVTQLLWNILKENSHQPDKSYLSVNNKSCRLEIRFSEQEGDKLAELAKSHHMTINAFIVSIIRNYLDKTPLLTAAEVEALYQSNSQLLRIGRNLNQIARQLNSMEGGSITSEQITSLQKIIDAHTEKVGNLLLANKRRNNE